MSPVINIFSGAAGGRGARFDNPASIDIVIRVLITAKYAYAFPRDSSLTL